MRASIPPWSSGLTTAGASRSPRGIASRSTSTRCCGRGSSRTGIARADEIHETDPVPWPVLERVHDAELLRRIRDGELSVREERGLGLPWSPELVERGRRAVAGTLAAARHALERGVAMNLGRRHPPRRPRLRARLLPVQRRRRRARRAARRRPRRAGARGRLRRPPGRRHRRPARPGPARLHGLAARRAQLPVPAHPVRPRRRPPDRHRRRRLPRGARRRARRRPAPLRARTSRSTSPAPTRGRATASAAWRSPRRACSRATSACSTACAPPASRSAWCSPAATRRTSATPSTSTRRPPPRSRQG